MATRRNEVSTLGRPKKAKPQIYHKPAGARNTQIRSIITVTYRGRKNEQDDYPEQSGGGTCDPLARSKERWWKKTAEKAHERVYLRNNTQLSDYRLLHHPFKISYKNPYKKYILLICAVDSAADKAKTQAKTKAQSTNKKARPRLNRSSGDTLTRTQKHTHEQ